ncbi:MAG: hypothetical protein P0Y49_06180 [Candidatus Pedobacter colombiensis]|uniref:Ankyrin repeat domain-containing protein n=1 Tax=Candidatus Pedobacter colombiensis TaxID=3121371 RepID=A0AAJ6B8W3_9SPHI|nr:hypothetical protein [Pedobacter sp.]WEK21825.1 MAG: hypothetical protein P0Y49_06180 [Pedobacter sp.]
METVGLAVLKFEAIVPAVIACEATNKSIALLVGSAKKEIKTFFKAIRDSDMPTISGLVNSNKAYNDACNFAPPKKDDGQSGLQVAFKTGNFDIALFLIKNGFLSSGPDWVLLEPFLV